MADGKPVPEYLVSQFVSLTCAMAWVLLTVPSVAVYISYLQRFLKKPCAKHVRDANRVLKYLRSKQHRIVYRRITGEIKLVAVSDSAFSAGEQDGLATRGAFLMMVGTDGIRSPGGSAHLIDWISKKQAHVCRSTLSAELFAALDAVNAAMKLNLVITELYWGPTSAAKLGAAQEAGELPVGLHLCLDARSVVEAVASSGPAKASEAHLTIHLLKLREWLHRRIIAAVWWVDTRDMCSDGLTKGKIPRDAITALAEQGVWKLVHEVRRVPLKDAQRETPRQ